MLFRSVGSPGVHGDRFGSAADDYARYRADFPAAGIDRMVALGVGTPGQRLLDLGCGTGTLARQFAARECTVTGVDVDARMLAAARSLAVVAGLQVAWWECPAEDTGLPSASFDVVTAAQCWHWFDGEAAAGEVRRLLVAGGLVAVCGFDWLPLPDTASGVTEALIQAHNPSWNLGGIRDSSVTGVQTCALPISVATCPVPASWWSRRSPSMWTFPTPWIPGDCEIGRAHV